MVLEYVDVGQSGAKDSRPEININILMDDAHERQFDAIVGWRFDRFARSTKRLLSGLEEFRSLGIQFISYHLAPSSQVIRGPLAPYTSTN